MKSRTITVWWKGSAMSVFKEIADLMGLQNNHRINSEDEFWEILGAKARHGIDRIELIKPVTGKAGDALN